MLGKLGYQIFILLYPVVARCVSPFNEKARNWVIGRKNWKKKLQQAFETNNQQVIWFHCSSLGEFEQGRPLIEKIKKQFPRYKVLLTFFSPSGYEVQKYYTGADYIFYLPIDSKKNAASFIDIVKPLLVIFVKYDFWNFYLNEIKKRNIPLLLASALFRKDQPFFKWYGSFHRSMLQCFTHLFVQNMEAKVLLEKINIKKVTISGDTRFDRVKEIADQFSPLPAIEKFIIQKQNVIVAGSTWADDDKILSAYAKQNESVVLIIAPHDIKQKRIDECVQLYPSAITLSAWNKLSEEENNNFKTLIIDNIGMLARLYYYGSICYVGGGFTRDGVHNVLEAAVYNKPVAIGPEYDKYTEVKELIAEQGAESIKTAEELKLVCDDLFVNNTKRLTTGSNAGYYVRSKTGATDKILSFIQKNRLLTN